MDDPRAIEEGPVVKGGTNPPNDIAARPPDPQGSGGAEPTHFPIMFGPGIKKGYVPWSLMMKHQSQAMVNHSQTIATLAGRGGLSPMEALAVVRDSRYFPFFTGFITAMDLPENFTNSRDLTNLAFDLAWRRLKDLVLVTFPEWDFTARINRTE